MLRSTISTAARRVAGVRPAGVRPAGVRPAGVRPAGVQPPGVRPSAGTVLLLLVFLPALAIQPPAARASAGAAVELAERVLESMAGPEAWAKTRFIRFDFFGRRLHHWDRYSGRHRLEGQTPDGDAYLVLHNIQSRKGRVWLNGEELAGEARNEWLERAYGAWVNDTYWLLMPYKLRDPGVNLEHAGEEEIDGTVYDKLLLTFDDVGLTPGDRYWAYVSRSTGLMERWAFHLQGWEAERAPSHWLWLDWQRYGRVMLSPRRKSPEDGSERIFGDLAVFDHLPDEVFTSPEPVAAD